MRSAAPSTADEIRARVLARTYDPLPTGDPAEGAFQWVSATGDVELARLGRLIDEGFRANLHVHYVQNHARPRTSALFRHLADGIDERPRLRLAAGVSFAEDRRVSADARWVEVRLRRDAPDSAIEFAVEDPAGLGADGWEWLDDDGRWQPATTHRGVSPDGSLHDRDPSADLVPVLQDGIWTLPAPVLGRPVIHSTARPSVVSGESPEETDAALEARESDFTVIRIGDDLWTTQHELGFRYLRVSGADVRSVTVRAAVHPVQRRGAFACSDERLTDVWVTSAYTLRQCMHELMLDGIKRDRMPWSGDQALNTLANAFTFADQEIVEASLTALGRNPVGYVNGITDYSFWWVVNFGFLVRHFDARAYVDREANHLVRFMRRLAADTDAAGVFHPRHHDEAFEKAVFIDWSATVDPTRTSTSLQLLWLWALRCATDVLETVEHPTVPEWRRRADDVEAMLLARAWNATAGGWTEYLDDEGGPPSAHAELFAALSGIARPRGVHDHARIRSLIPTSTPFISGFALGALGASGRAEWAIDDIRGGWGAMLDRGARTFWEEFPLDGRSDFEMYGRPFGKSLCHAWAAGPAALLPQLICGIRPLAAGWSRFAVEPEPGALDWVGTVVPTPTGDIVVVVDGREVTVEVPAGSVLERDSERFPGPVSVRFELERVGEEPVRLEA